MLNFHLELKDLDRQIRKRCSDPNYQGEGPVLQSLPLLLGTPNFDAALEMELKNIEDGMDTEAYVIVSNTGDTELDVLQPGAVLESEQSFISQMRMIKNENEQCNLTLPWTRLDSFTGEYYTDQDWLKLKPGQTHTARFDAATIFDLSKGGDFSFMIDTTMIAKYLGKYLISLHVTSSTLELKNVDGVRAARAMNAAQARNVGQSDANIMKRLGIQKNPDCGRLRSAKLNGALAWAARMAADGAIIALGIEGFQVYNDKFAQFFHAYENEARCYVANRLMDVAKELRIHGRYAQSWVQCDDLYQRCNTGHFYTYRHPDTPNIIQICPRMYRLKHYEKECFQESWASALLHQALQLPLAGTAACQQIVNGFPEATILTWNEAKRNADTYVWFAQSMKFLLQVLLAVFAAAQASTSGHLPKVDVKITSAGNTAIRASITNTGEYDLSIKKLNSLFDSRNVRKIDVNATADGTPLVFEGSSVVPSHRTDAGSWLQIAKGDVFVTEFDVADLYDLSPGGNYTVKAEGTAFIEPPTAYTDLQLNYSSNTLYIQVDGAEAAKRKAAGLSATGRLVTRAEIGADCSDEQKGKIRQALHYCRLMAWSGARGAEDADERFFYYFHTFERVVRDHVRCKFLAVAEECQERPGKSWFTCLDSQLQCQYNTLAVTNPRTGLITLCDFAWQLRLVYTNVCHDDDLATTLIHEMTHVNGLHGSATDDIYRHDKWPKCKDLDWFRSVNNAETYASFAQCKSPARSPQLPRW
ncbi:hypothetical protein SLS55_001534 [Diplodia seriata]|uniref:deuterolysin n=1 Tax=Diplodia seriata TaxID=420778 RepID=A0ABR3CS84_9PEZI